MNVGYVIVYTRCIIKGFSGIGGAGMKRIFLVVAIVLAIIVMTLVLQSCFSPYPAIGDPRRESRDREIREEMQRDLRW